MPTFYLDSSAILKRYVEETGSEWVRIIAGLHAHNILHLSQITRVEVVLLAGVGKVLSLPMNAMNC